MIYSNANDQQADFLDPDWKNNYYGVNYDRLLQIKNRYDPEHQFYALTAVGSDYWEVQADGRLCGRASDGVTMPNSRRDLGHKCGSHDTFTPQEEL